MSSPASTASSNVARSASSMRFGKLASTTTVTVVGLELLEERAHCLVELLQARQGASLGREVRSVDDDVLDGHPVCKSTSCVRVHRGMLQQIARDMNSPRAATSNARARSVACDDDEVTDLLQHLIRNACVNDGTDDVRTRGAQRRSPRRRTSKAAGSTASATKPAPGRTSLVARIEGSDPDAPTLLLMGHTDVVPVNPDGWRHDPFGGELIDGEVWGRGAVDMLNLTASMAVATKRLARDGLPARRARSIYLAVADEEALGSPRGRPPRRPRGRRRAGRLRDHRVRRHPDPQPHRAEAAGDRRREGQLLGPAPRVGHAGPRLAALQDRQRPRHGGRRGPAHRRVRARHRDPRHLAAVPRGHGLPGGAGRPAARPRRLRRRVRRAARSGMARQFHACTHTTFAPTIAHGGTKINVDPRPRRPADRHPHPARATATPRCAPCSTRRSATWPPKVELVASRDDPSTASPIDTPLWDSHRPGHAGASTRARRSCRS